MAEIRRQREIGIDLRTRLRSIERLDGQLGLWFFCTGNYENGQQDKPERAKKILVVHVRIPKWI